ncbi:MAG: amino acid-binding protein, partial [Methanobacteriaceae archaeon]
MWSQIKEKFKGYPAQFSVAGKMVDLGLRIDSTGKIFCKDLEISNVALAKSANVDRRAINATAETILNDPFLFNVFSKMSPAGPLLKNIAKSLNLGVIEITADSQNSGLLGEVANLISSKKINIRQA